MLSRVSLDGRLHTLHRPLRAAGGVQCELEIGSKMSVWLPLSMLWQYLAASLRKSSPMTRGQSIGLRLGYSQQEEGGQQTAVVQVKLIVGNELDK